MEFRYDTTHGQKSMRRTRVNAKVVMQSSLPLTTTAKQWNFSKIKPSSKQRERASAMQNKNTRITIKQFMKLAGENIDTVYKWVTTHPHLLAPAVVAGQIVFDRKAVIKFLKKHRPARRTYALCKPTTSSNNRNLPRYK